MRPNVPVVESALDAVPVIPEHELLRPIASGAYGQVWLARSALGTLRAVKIVRRDRFERADDFEREFRGLQRFEPVSRTHEALVDVLQIGRQDDWFYYVMELADDAAGERSDGVLESGGNGALGQPQHSNTPIPQRSNAYVPQTLRQRIRDGGFLPATEVVALGHRLASALAHLHAQDLVHRDVKPSNILFINGQPKLADAGLVAAVDDACSLVGTPGYIPPEGPGTPQADIYSLGKVLYETAFGKDRQEFPQLPPDLATRPDHAALLELNEIIAKACAHDPRQRYATAQALLAELELLKRSKSVKRRRVLQHFWQVTKKGSLAALLVGLATVATVRLTRGDIEEHIRARDPEVKKLMDQADRISDELTRQDEAIKLYRNVIALDPKFAPAYVGLFGNYLTKGGSDWNAPSDLRNDLLATATKLRELEPNCAESHLALGITKWMDFQFPEALAEVRAAALMRREVSADGHEFAHMMYGFYLLQTGKPSESLREYLIAQELNGANPITQHHLGHPHFAQGQLDLALAQYKKALDVYPRHWAAQLWIGHVFEEKKDYLAAIEAFRTTDRLAGRYDSAAEHFYDELRDAALRDPAKGYWQRRLYFALLESPPNWYYVATLHARLGEWDDAYAWLRKACEHRAFDQGPMFDLCWDHNDERFRNIMKGIRLMQ